MTAPLPYLFIPAKGIHVENLLQDFLHAIMSETKNIFLFFLTFCKFKFNFKHLQKKDDPHS